MAVSIISCPSCDSMLLEDTVQCPTCRHVLKPDEFASSGLREIEATAPAAAASAGETVCSACGEGVRNGLVRCWNCGTFMNAAVQQTFSQLQATPGRQTGPVLTYSVGADDAIPLAPDSSADETLDSVSQAYDEDFEVAPEFELRMPSVTLGNYSLTWQNAIPDAASAEIEPDSYRLAMPDASDSSAEIPVTQVPEPPPAPAPVVAESRPIPQVERTAPPEEEVAHSEATAGDVLLEIALNEEKQAAEKKVRSPRKKAATGKARSGVIVFCPKGHRIEVQEKHRGMLGRCPKCKLPFFVPIADEAASSVPSADNAANASPDKPASTATEDSATPVFGAAVPTGTFWMLDVALHVVNPAKVKAKPGCLAKSFVPADVAIRGDGIVVATLGKAGGLFGLGAKKPDALRQAIQQHLAEGKPVSELPAAAKLELLADSVSGLKIVQPIVYAHECPFGDVAVFGEGRIVVQLPTPADAAEKQFLSFPLSQFREFVQQIRGRFSLPMFGENAGIPLIDSYSEDLCTYTDAKITSLNDSAFYAADPAFKLEIVGRKCTGCGIIVGEDARKKEKIGGLDGKGIAKAKCPKCSAKFGNISLVTLVRP